MGSISPPRTASARCGRLSAWAEARTSRSLYIFDIPARGSVKKAGSSNCDAPTARICGRGRVRAAAILVLLLGGPALETGSGHLNRHADPSANRTEMCCSARTRKIPHPEPTRARAPSLSQQSLRQIRVQHRVQTASRAARRYGAASLIVALAARRPRASAVRAAPFFGCPVRCPPTASPRRS